MDVTTSFIFFFFFNNTATPEIYTLSLPDALPIYQRDGGGTGLLPAAVGLDRAGTRAERRAAQHDARRHQRAVAQQGTDRKSTRLNSSHANISYAVFCLKKKKKHQHICTVLG